MANTTVRDTTVRDSDLVCYELLRRFACKWPSMSQELHPHIYANSLHLDVINLTHSYLSTSFVTPVAILIWQTF